MKIENINLGLQNLEAYMSDNHIDLDKNKMVFIGGGQGGSKIASEFIRLGHYGFIYNTCKEDLEYSTDILDKLKEKNINYDSLLLKGENGSYKNREAGKQAIMNNQEIIKKEFLSDTRLSRKIKEAEFVWITVALGGGTGNGSLATIAKLVSQIRSASGKNFNGKTTVGVIAAVPKSNSFYGIELNSAEAIQEIKVLQSNNILGSCLLIDNDKLHDHYNNSEGNLKDWTMFGNLYVARVLTEFISASSLTGSYIFDSSEMKDLFTTPGFLSISKMKVGIEEFKDENIYKTIVKNIYTSSNVLTDGFDIKHASTAGLLILRDKRTNVINDRHDNKLQNEMREYLGNTLIEKDFYGVHYINDFGTIKTPKATFDEVIIYGIVSYRSTPMRITESTKRALIKKREKEELENSINDEFMDLDLSTKKVEPKNVDNTPTLNDIENMDLNDLFLDVFNPKQNAKVISKEDKLTYIGDLSNL